MTGDVLKEAPSRLNCPNDVGDVGPEVAGIVGSELLAGNTERLTRVTANDSIHEAAPRARVEGLEIGPNRRVIQDSGAHRFDQYAGSRDFVLHVADCASASESAVNAEVESSSTAGETEDGR